MTETPDERRERIDDARRDQAELLRQIGHEHASNVIRPSAMEAWRNLQFQIVEVDDRKGRRPCRGKEEAYTNYDAFNVPSPGRARMMCSGCEVTACPVYAMVENPGWGVYGGVVYGKKLADIERRETIKSEIRSTKPKEEV